MRVGGSLSAVLVVAGLLSAVSTFNAAADESGARQSLAPLTPYGELCPGGNRYGRCRGRMSFQDAVKVLNDYYAEKNFTVRVIDVQGRFIKAEILDDEKVVDVVIFDCRFGRIRSIY